MRPAPLTPRTIAIAGLAALAVAMGIGRFAFTPIMPMMLRDGGVDLPGASWLASANYLGYFVGALVLTIEPWLRRRLAWRLRDVATAPVARGLAATALLTLAMALPWPAAWPALRFAAGVASAYVFVHAAGWFLSQLAARGASGQAGVMFAGPGAGIVGSGLLASAMVAWDLRAATAWVAFAAVAASLTLWIGTVFRATSRSSAGVAFAAGDHAARADDRQPVAAHGSTRVRHRHAEVAVLAFAYGLSGFGYIVTATFLPVIARAAVPGSPLVDLFWPIFGAGIVCGALASTRLHPAIDRRLLLAGAYALQAAGIALGLAWPSEPGFAIGSLMLGLPFTLITLWAIEEVRRIRPDATASMTGLTTTMFALCQAAGPSFVAAMLRATGGDADAAFARSLIVAAAVLVVGAAVFAASARTWPRAPSVPARITRSQP